MIFLIIRLLIIFNCFIHVFIQYVLKYTSRYCISFVETLVGNVYVSKTGKTKYKNYNYVINNNN